MTVKRCVFAEVEAVVGPECVLATNTSSLSVSAMASGLAHPERVVGFHFFYPVAVLPLVEVVRGEATDDATLATALAGGQEAEEVLHLRRALRVRRQPPADPGSSARSPPPWTRAPRSTSPSTPRNTLGLPMTQFLLLQLVGPAIALHVAETLHAAYPDRFAVSPACAPWSSRARPASTGPTSASIPRWRRPSQAETSRFASWKMTPSVWRWPERKRLTPWRMFTR